MKNFIVSRLQRKFRIGIIRCLLIMVIVCAVGALLLWFNMDQPAYKTITSNAQLEEIEAADDLAKITVTDLAYTGSWVGENEENIDAYDFFAVIEESGEDIMVSLKADRITEAELDNPPATYQINCGWVAWDQDFNDWVTANYFEGDAEWFNETLAGYIIVEADVQDIIEGYELDSTLIVIGIALAVVLVLLIFQIVNLCNPKGSRQFRTLKKLSGDLEQNLAGIDREMRDGQPAKVGEVLISRNWVVTAKAYAYKTEDIIWAYIAETKHYRNGIPTGTTYKGHMGLKDGTLVEAYNTSSSKLSPVFMEKMNESAPYAVYGFSEDIKRIFNKERDQMLAVVEENRRNAVMGDGM